MLTSEVPVEIHMFAWMNLENPDMTMDEAVAELKALGNDILEIDEENRRVKVADVTEKL